MKRCQHLMLIFTSLFFVVSWPAASQAAEKASVPSGKDVKKPLVQPLAASALAAPPSLCSVLIDEINGIVKLVHKDMQKTVHLYMKPGGKDYITFPGMWELYYISPQYRNHVQGCCSQQKSFSVQDQKAAGCTNSDTVKQCMDKLVRHCIGGVKKNAQLKTDLKHSQEKAAILSVQTKELSERLNKLIATMP